MAIMHPQNLNNYKPTESERVFFDELEKQLDDSFLRIRRGTVVNMSFPNGV